MPRPSTARGTVIGVAAADGLCGLEFSEIHRTGDTNSYSSGLRLIWSATLCLQRGRAFRNDIDKPSTIVPRFRYDFK